ncbi:serine threonine- phosphatase with EF-hands 1 isoform X1, partial [Pelobates cultripes]
IKAAVLIQRWYRFYTARLEMRRRYTLSIFQSIEYAEEQAQLQLSNFFTFMIDHFAEVNGPGPDLISDIVNCSREEQRQLEDYEMLEVPNSYDGPQISFPLTVSDTNTLLHAFKQEKQLHARYVLQLFHETQTFLKQMPNVVHISTSYSKELTICGDLHGKLDDLLLIFYKNGLPSPDNPYLFNGDFVDRGKNSVEILIILFAFLLVYPNHLHLNRGNHEDPIMNMRYGFTKEIMQKYKKHGQKMLHLLEDIYSQLPLATIVDSKILILHGGIADTTDLDYLTSFERNKYKSALRPPKPQKHNKPNQTSSQNTMSGHKTDGSDECYSPALFSQSKGTHNMMVRTGLSRNSILEIHYLDSNIQMPDMTPELTATEREEWKQVVDILWSDPRNQNGCLPNSFRGGGCYFGPDVTAKLLDKYNLKMLIRSHECKEEGYEICHNGKVITIFSASNYYDEGSNRGAYLKLCPALAPRFVQYQVNKCTRKLTLHQRVSAVEDSAFRALQEKIYTHRSDLMKAFREHDPKETGRISISEWALSMEAVLHLNLPWRTLRSRLAKINSDGTVEYLSCFEDLQIQQPVKEVQPNLIETLQRYRADLELVFNIIDKDHSGLISIEEFRQTWKFFSSHLHIDIDDETIDDLAHSIDSNKDGSIDFHEFLEAFRVVNKFDKNGTCL